MADTVFTCGRYRNKTFEQVANSDEDFCNAVLQSKADSKYYPDAFKQYLIATKKKILPFLGAFEEELTAEDKNELKEIVGDLPHLISNCHIPVDTSKYHSSGLKGIFYRCYFTKCVASRSIRNEKISSGLLNDFASIFPFKTSKNVERKCLPVMRLFDVDFKKKIETFVKHFEQHECRELVDLFFANVLHCRLKHFDQKSVQKLKTFVEKKVYDERNSRNCKVDFTNDLLKSFPRINFQGIHRYQQYQNDFRTIQNAYHKTEFPKKSQTYFQFLPEINFYELFSLLETELYESDRVLYLDRLKKYLFFFGYAIDRADHPVFFIDDILFECLKFYPIYREPLNDVLSEEEEYVLWMMALVRSRKKYKIGSCKDVSLDRENFEKVMNYVKDIPGIKTSDAILNFLETNELCDIRINCKLLVGDTLYEVCYSKQNRQLSSFLVLLMKAAIVSKNIRKIVFYNAYLGTETSLIVPQEIKSKIINFICKYNKPRYSKPEAFLISNYEFFENL